MAGFAHLHCHTDHSFLDGVGRSVEYAELAARAGHTHLACTDHGNLYGLPEHRRACERFGLRPVYGCEMYVNDRRDETAALKAAARSAPVAAGAKDPEFSDNHLVLLCENNAGWRNLLSLNHDSVRNGYYYKPRTTHDLVLSHAEGLFASTACMGSRFGQLALAGRSAELREMLGRFRDAFGDRFFVEVHVNEIPDQKTINGVLLHEARRLRLPCVFASDVHYACRGDVARQDEMIAVARHTALNDPKAWRLEARHLWFTDPDNAFAFARSVGMEFGKREWSAWVAASQEIAERCSADIYGDGSLRPPRYIDESGLPVENPYALLARLAVDGLRARFPGGVPLEYVSRLKHELSVIRRLGLADFYLVTMDVVRECKARGVMVWCRGSGCASLVAAAIGITPIDPLRFRLLFERFVDPSRPQAPDFDLDIDSAKRDAIMAWLVGKYGGPGGVNISRISAVSTFGFKAALRDVLWAHGVSGGVAASLSSVLNDHQVKPLQDKLSDVGVEAREGVIDEAVAALREHCPARLAPALDANAPLVRAALSMVGRARNRQKHAAGFVVAPGPVEEFIPIDRIGSGSEAEFVTAWGEGQASQDIAGTGLLKLDLLGLNTISAASMCIALASRRTGRDVAAEVDGWNMDFSDPAVLREYRSGLGFGLHQLGESDQTLAAFVAKLKPRGVDDVVASVALYRPGAMAFLDDYLSRAHGLSDAASVHPLYDELMADTHGIIVYQEQVMYVLHRLGGIPLREAYNVIKAISKKKKDAIHASRAVFISNARSLHGLSEAEAAGIFDVIERFAGYGFNKAHSASYAVLSWVTAYLRAKYPVEFWWAWLCRVPNKAAVKSGGERKIELYLRAASRSVRLVAPRVGLSGAAWRSGKDCLVAPLTLCLGVGAGAATAIDDAWRVHRWPDFFAFLRWAEANRRACSSGALLALARCNAFRAWVPHARACDLVSAWTGFKVSKKGGSRTDQLERALADAPLEVAPSPEGDEISMALERLGLGFTFWFSPWVVNKRAAKLAALVAADRVAGESEPRLRGRRRGFLVQAARVTKDSRGREMAFLSARSASDRSVKMICFSSVWGSLRHRPRPDRVYLVAGEFDPKGCYIVSGGACPFKDIDGVSVDGMEASS